jgi:hypothetical protein
VHRSGTATGEEVVLAKAPARLKDRTAWLWQRLLVRELLAVI